MAVGSVGTVWVDVKFNVGDIGRQLQTALGRATAGASAAGAGAAALERTWTQSLGAIGDSATKLGKQMTATLTLPIALIGKSAVKSFSEFDKSMTKMAAINKEDVTEGLRNDVRALGKEFGVAAEEVGDAMYFITSSGQKGAAAMEILQVSTKAAAVGLGETKVVADVITSALSAYRGTALTAAKAGDVLAAAVRTGKGEADELAGSLSQVIPLAANAGVSFEEMAGAMSAMTLSGTSSDQAATQLRGLFNTLQDMPPIAQRALTAYTGLDAATLRLKVRSDGLVPTLKLIFDRFGDNRDAMAEVFGNIRALTGIMNLFGNNTEQTLRIIQEVTNASGELNDAWEITAESKSKKMDIAMNNIHDAMIGIGAEAIPMVTGVANAVGGLLSVFGALPGPIQAVTVGFAGVAAAAGPVAFAFGSITKGISGIGNIVSTVAPSLKRFSDGLRLQAMYANEASRSGTGLMAKMGGLNQALGALGVAVAAGAAGWAIWNNAMSNADEQAQALGESLARGAESGGIPKTTESIAKANEQIAIMKTEIEGLEGPLTNAARILSFAFGPIAIVAAFLNKDFTEAEKKAIAELERGNKVLADRAALSKDTADLTGANIDKINDWLAAEYRQERTYKTAKEAQEAMTKALLAGDPAAKAAAGSVNNAANALGTLETRAKATADQFFAYVDAEKAVTDAQKGLADAQQGVLDAQDDYAEAQRKTLDAERDIAVAQRKSVDATRAVVSARQKLIDVQNELNDALRGPSEDEQLDVREAKLSVQEAQKGLKEPSKDPLERQRAQIALRRAQINLERTLGAHDERVAGLRDEVASAEKGVNDAVQAELDAKQAVVDARLAKTQASKDQAQAARDVKDAEDGVAQAERDLLGATTDFATKQSELNTALSTGALNGSAFLNFLAGLRDQYPEMAGVVDQYTDKFNAMWAAAGGKEPNAPKPPEIPPPPPPTPQLDPALNLNPLRGMFGRAYGGSLQAGQLSMVNERGMPELWSANGKQYLLPTAGGQVTPLKPLDIDVHAQGGDGVTIGDIYVQGAESPTQTAYEVRRQIRAKGI